MELKSLTQQSECAGAESGCLRILSECLGDSSMHLGVPFIAPRQLGAVEDQEGSPVHHRTGPIDGPVRDCLPNRAQMTVAAPGPLAHWTLSGAHQTVRCTSRPLEQTTCHAKIVRPTVGAGDRWLTGQSGEPPGSPVNYSHVAPLLFPRATSSPRMTHRTVQCTTEWSDEL
jgi:hypothetical protein